MEELIYCINCCQNLNKTKFYNSTLKSKKVYKICINCKKINNNLTFTCLSLKHLEKLIDYQDHISNIQGCGCCQLYDFNNKIMWCYQCEMHYF